MTWFLARIHPVPLNMTGDFLEVDVHVPVLGGRQDRVLLKTLISILPRRTSVCGLLVVGAIPLDVSLFEELLYRRKGSVLSRSKNALATLMLKIVSISDVLEQTIKPVIDLHQGVEIPC